MTDQAAVSDHAAGKQSEMHTSDASQREGPVGLIAGEGIMPLLVARGMHAAGRDVHCVCLTDEPHELLRPLCAHFRSVGAFRPGSWLRAFRRWHVDEAVMVGRVSKKLMHNPRMVARNIPDLRAVRLWFGRLRHDRRNAMILAALADDLSNEGVRLIDSTTYIPDHVASVGVLGTVRPTPTMEADITFGWPLLRQIVELDVGQSIVVRNRDVVAVEAVEGTDGMIDRASELCKRKGWTLLKSAKENHDNRCDVPTIGTHTVTAVHEGGGKCITVGAGRVVLLDKPDVIATADKLGIAMIGVNPDGSF